MTKNDTMRRALMIIGIVMSLIVCVLFIFEIIDTAHEVSVLHTIKDDFGLSAQSRYLYNTDIIMLTSLICGAVVCAIVYPISILLVYKGKRTLFVFVVTAALAVLFCFAAFRSAPFSEDLAVKNGIAFKYSEEAFNTAEEYGDLFSISKSDMWYPLGRSKDKTGCHFIAREINSSLIYACGYEEFFEYDRGVDIAHTPLPVIVTEAYASKLGWSKGDVVPGVYFLNDVEYDTVDYDDGSHEAIVTSETNSFSVKVVDILKTGERYPLLSGSPVSADSVLPAVREGDLALFCPEMYCDGEKVSGKSFALAEDPDICLLNTEDDSAFEELTAVTDAKKLSEMYKDNDVRFDCDRDLSLNAKLSMLYVILIGIVLCVMQFPKKTK